MKYIFSIGLMLLLVLTFTACTTELYQKNMIKAIGIDLVADEYEITVRYSTLDEEDDEKIVKSKGDTVYDALNKLSLITGKEQMYSKTSFVVIGEEVAKDGVDKVIDFFIRYFRSRPTVNLYVSKGSASEILNTEIDGKLIPTDTIQSYTENSENTGKTVTSTVLELISETNGQGTSSILPLIEKTEKDEILCTKSVVLKDYKLVYELSEEETHGFLMAMGQYENGTVVVHDKNDNKISTQVDIKDAMLEYELIEGAPKFSLKIKAEAAIVAVPLLDEDANYYEIENLISEEINKLAEQCIKNSHENDIDILSLGYNIYINDSQYWRENSENFEKTIHVMNVNVSTETDITRIGEEDNPFY